jgi:hypothetical protein
MMDCEVHEQEGRDGPYYRREVDKNPSDDNRNQKMIDMKKKLEEIGKWQREYCDPHSVHTCSAKGEGKTPKPLLTWIPILVPSAPSWSSTTMELILGQLSYSLPSNAFFVLGCSRAKGVQAILDGKEWEEREKKKFQFDFTEKCKIGFWERKKKNRIKKK